MDNSWHQSKIPGRSQREFIQRQIKRETESNLGRCTRQITRDCKEMLRKKLEEFHVYNNQLSQKHNTIERHRRYICFECRLRGHIAKNCPNRERMKGIEGKGSLTNSIPTEITYPETIHLSTDFMIEGTDEGEWDKIWYVSNKIDNHVCTNMHLFSKLKEKFMVEKLKDIRKLLFIHGIGEVTIRIGTELFLIPGVHYTPEVTLSILSAKQLEAQGLELSFRGNRCRLTPMFKEPSSSYFDKNRMNDKQNSYMKDYLNS